MSAPIGSRDWREPEPELTDGIGSLSLAGLRDLAWLRRALYRFSGALFLPPDDDRRVQLTEAARTLCGEQESLAEFPWYLAWQPLLNRLAAGEWPPLPELQEAYTWLFVAAAGGQPCCPPYASYYLDPDRRAAGWIPLALEQEYRSTGMTVSPLFRGTPDHLAVELEYMATLCSREAEAWEQGATRDTRTILRRERRFVERFLCTWLPAFARQVHLADPTTPYVAAVDAVDAFVQHDLDLVSLLLGTLPEVHR